MQIRIAGIANDSIVDGPGIRFTIFAQGCPHRCPGCHNPQTHDFNGGYFIDTDNLLERITANPLLDGVTFSGGEPFSQAEPLYQLGVDLLKKGYTIITYTGYTFEFLLEHADESNYFNELLSVTDFLVDGQFKEEKKNYLLKFKGSENQRILDCKRSLAKGIAIETEL